MVACGLCKKCDQPCNQIEVICTCCRKKMKKPKRTCARCKKQISSTHKFRFCDDNKVRHWNCNEPRKYLYLTINHKD